MIRVENLTKTYHRGTRHANWVLRDVSFTLPETGFVCILGASGCGKTSLLNAIGGLDSFDSGTVTGENIRLNRSGTAAYELWRSRSFGYIFQNYYLLPDHSAAYNVYLGLHSLDLTHSQKLQRVRQALQAVDMERYYRRRVGELSGGQQQRVAIARAIAKQPRVIFADEPTGNLDEANTFHICSLLRQISKTSLVVMVTHEERLARFFADRILTVENGQITADDTRWQRQALAADSTSLYAGEYREEVLSRQGLRLRMLRQEDAPEVELTVLALKDRVIVKLADRRTVICSEPDKPPLLREGCRPVLTLQELEQASMELPVMAGRDAGECKPGGGLGFSMLLREAVRLSGGGRLRRLSVGLFLLLLTVLTVFTVSDYLTLAHIDPEDFITSDSHILELQVQQGPNIYEDGRSFSKVTSSYIDYLRRSCPEVRFVPHVSISAEYNVTVFRQMDQTTLKFLNFSYVPLEALREETLIHGRMPENSSEIVVDRWVLEAAVATDGIIQNSIGDVSYFLGTTLHYDKRSYAPTVVGICDSGQPSVYMSTAGLISIGISGVPVTPLSELQSKYPGEYDHVTLEPGECLVVTGNAGTTYYNRVGQKYTTGARQTYDIVDAIDAEVQGSIVLSDDALDHALWTMYNQHFHLYCPDRDAALAFLSEHGSEMEQGGYAIIEVSDHYKTTYDQYLAASRRKTDARSVVTATVLAVCMVMVYLICRSRVRQRVGMLAVYRLLGIPAGKPLAVFALESVKDLLTAVLPGLLAVWGYLALGQRIEELGTGLVLPWQAALLTFAGISAFYLAASLLPAARLLLLPPARLAAKYDI